MKNRITRSGVAEILTAVFVTATILANVLAGRVWVLYGDWTLSGGVFIFPISLVVGDILSEIYGWKKTKKVIMIGFLMSAVAVGIYNIINVLPAPVWFEEGANAYKSVLGTTWRALLGGLTAFVIGHLVNSKILVKMKERGGNEFWFRAMVSTVFGELVDSVIFVFIMFSFVMPINVLLMMILLQVVTKSLVEALVLPITNRIVNVLKEIPEVV